SPHPHTFAVNFVVNTFPARSHKILGDALSAATGDPHFFICRIGPDSTFRVPAGCTGIWWSCRGSAKAIYGDAVTSLDRRSIVVSDSQRPLDIVTGATGRVIGFVATIAHWRILMSGTDFGSCRESLLFPALHRATRHACRLIVRTLRASEDDASPISGAVNRVVVVTELIDHLQRPFESLIARCPGRSLQQKRTIFMRLQRARNHLVSNTHRALNIKSLAFSANYSVWRFIRLYGTVFGETPYAAISRCRIEQAQQLLQSADTCVGDVASAVGFESRSALTRALKKRFGANATQLRTTSRRSQRVRSPAASLPRIVQSHKSRKSS
ncbi:MAG: AraC family transcriptional regulator, partial [Rudaea sp.]